MAFEQPFTRFPYPCWLRFGKAAVAYWGINPDISKKVERATTAKQVFVLDYRSDDDFVLRFKTKSDEDRLILAKVEPSATLAETVAKVRQRVSVSQESNLEEKDALQVPLIDCDVLRDYQELVGKRIMARGAEFDGSPIVLALQKIQFKLNETGAELKSGALLGVIGDFGIDPDAKKPRMFIFDKPFLVLLEREGAKSPYFALWVGNGELLVPYTQPK